MIVKAINEDLQRVGLTYEDANKRLYKMLTAKSMDDVENENIEAKKIAFYAHVLKPKYIHQVSKWETKLGKSIALWNNEELREFEDYFIKRFINDKFVT